MSGDREQGRMTGVGDRLGSYYGKEVRERDEACGATKRKAEIQGERSPGGGRIRTMQRFEGEWQEFCVVEWSLYEGQTEMH